MSHINNIVKKPWGYEYLVYENEHAALWFLYIAHEQSTSMHCHPNKTTGLAVLDGEVTVSFLSDKFPLSSGKKLMIRKGLFHSTCATSKAGAGIFEIETPVDKHDLVRFEDAYGREGKPYEDSTFETPKQEDCLWITDPEPGAINTYDFFNCVLEVSSVTDVSYFRELEDDVNLTFLRGGLVTDYGVNVAGPGDIVSSNIIKKLINVFKEVDQSTVVMIIKNNHD